MKIYTGKFLTRLLLLMLALIFVKYILSRYSSSLLATGGFSKQGWNEEKLYKKGIRGYTTTAGSMFINGNVSRRELSEEDFLRNASLDGFVHSKGHVNSSLNNIVKSIVDDYGLKTLMSPTDPCQNTNLSIFSYVHSRPDHYEKRKLIRETWGNSDNYQWHGLTLKTIFVLGVPQGEVSDFTMKAVQAESNHYNDILMVEFIDSYRNLTIKALVGMKYAWQHCRNSQFILKMDDDMFVNIFKVWDLLHTQDNVVDDQIMCHIWRDAKVFRDNSSKWYISQEEYSNDTYPAYCSGAAVIMTSSVPGQLLKASRDIPPIYIDDVYIYGILRTHTHLKLTSLNSQFRLFSERPLKNSCLRFTFIHRLPRNIGNLYWKVITREYSDMESQHSKLCQFTNNTFSENKS